MFDYKELALGLVYYTNTVEDPQQIVRDILDLEEKRKSLGHDFTNIKAWQPWDYDYGKPERTIYCWQKWIPTPENLDRNDPLYNETLSISKRLYDGLEACVDHYKNQLYPWAGRNLKSREHSMSFLRYESGGYLPAHSDHGVSSRTLSCVMYLNDDYGGGDIVFQHAGVTVSPEAGSIVFFPSNFVYVHEVKEITQGTRYAVPNWYHNRKEILYSDGTE